MLAMDAMRAGQLLIASRIFRATIISSRCQRTGQRRAPAASGFDRLRPVRHQRWSGNRSITGNVEHLHVNAASVVILDTVPYRRSPHAVTVRQISRRGSSRSTPVIAVTSLYAFHAAFADQRHCARSYRLPAVFRQYNDGSGATRRRRHCRLQWSRLVAPVRANG